MSANTIPEAGRYLLFQLFMSSHSIGYISIIQLKNFKYLNDTRKVYPFFQTCGLQTTGDHEAMVNSLQIVQSNRYISG